MNQASNLLGQRGKDGSQPMHNPDVSHHRLFEMWKGMTVRFPRLGKLSSKFSNSSEQPASTQFQPTSEAGDRPYMFQGDYSGLLLAGVLGGIMIYAVYKS